MLFNKPMNKFNNKCYICGSSDLSDTGYKLRDSEELKVLKCNNCTLMFLSSFDHIDESFYDSGKMHGTSFNIDKWLQNCKPDDERRFKFLKKHINGKALLDFGCGAGGFLILAKDYADVYGIERQDSLENHFKKNNIKVFKSLNDIDKKFDIITMFHVLEHLKDPVAALQELLTYLKDNGEIIIEVPNSDDALLSIYKCSKFANFTHWRCHLYSFNEKSLKIMLKKAGIKINYIKPVQRYGLANHLYWLIKGDKGGHLKWKFFNIFDPIYKTLLKVLRKTDTLIISISK